MAASKTGTIIKVWQDATSAYAAVSVPEGGAIGTVEYVVSTPLKKDDGSTKSATELKADLTAAVTAKRAAQLDGPSAVGGISGNISV